METQHYQDNLAGKKVAFADGQPQTGYYRMRKAKGGPFVPVAIWPHNGAMVAMVGTGEPGGKVRREPTEIWTYCCDDPVSKDDAKYAFENGKWRGDAPTLGHNSREYPATYEGIAAEFSDYAELVRQFLADVEKAGGIRDKVKADQASNMADYVGSVKGGIAKRADDMRDALVRPHLEAQREINTKFKPLIDEAKSLDGQLRRAAGAWAKAEQDRLRKEAEEKARIEREKNTSAEIHVVPEVPKVQVGGERAAKRSLKTKLVAQITDYEAALAHFKDADDVRNAVAALAQRAVKAGMKSIPGVKIVEEASL